MRMGGDRSERKEKQKMNTIVFFVKKERIAATAKMLFYA